jgi:hypothetical protein
MDEHNPRGVSPGFVENYNLISLTLSRTESLFKSRSLHTPEHCFRSLDTAARHTSDIPARAQDTIRG